MHASSGSVIIMNQLKTPFKDSYSYPIHTSFPIIASNENSLGSWNNMYILRFEYKMLVTYFHNLIL